MEMMHVNVEIQGGESFSIQLHPSQLIRDIKEKVQNLQHIPVRQQIILHNQQLLYDDLNVQECFIQNGSRIIVQIHADAPFPAFSPVDDSDFATVSPSPERYSDLPPSRDQVRDLNLPPSQAPMGDLNLPPSPAPGRDLNLPPWPVTVRDLNLPPSPAPLRDLNLPLFPAPVHDLNLPPLRGAVLDLNLPPSPSPSPSPSPLNRSDFPPVPSPSPSPLPSPLYQSDLRRVPSPSPSPSPSPLYQSDLPVVPSPTFGSDLTPQPTPDLQLPTLLNKEYNPSDIPPWNPSLQLIQTSNEDDPLEVGEFSSSPLLMPMPNTPSRVKEAAESVPSLPPLPQWLPPPPPPPPPHMPNPLPPPPPTVTVNVKVPKSRDRVRIESDRKGTVRELKEKIVALEDMQGVPVDRIVLQLHSMRLELMDHVPLHDCAVAENSQIDVFLKPALEVAGSSEGQSRKLKVTVLPMRTNEIIEIEVFSLDKVSVLRQKLDELHQTQGFILPEDGGYFFIHQQQGMHEGQSFDWHGVNDGDTIQTFDGILTTNSSSPSPSPSPSPPSPTLSPSPSHSPSPS